MKVSDGLLLLPRAVVTEKESCVVLVPGVPERGRASQRGGGSSQRPSLCPPYPQLMKLGVKLPSVLLGWRQGSPGTAESQLEESKSE